MVFCCFLPWLFFPAPEEYHGNFHRYTRKKCSVTIPSHLTYIRQRISTYHVCIHTSNTGTNGCATATKDEVILSDRMRRSSPTIRVTGFPTKSHVTIHHSINLCQRKGGFPARLNGRYKGKKEVFH